MALGFLLILLRELESKPSILDAPALSESLRLLLND